MEEKYERIKNKRESIVENCDDLIEERNRLSSIISHLKQKTKGLFDQLGTKKSLIAEKDAKIHDLTIDNKDLKKDLQKLEKEEKSNSYLKKKVKKYEEKVDELEDELNKEKHYFLSETKKLNEEIQSIQIQNEQKIRDINELNNMTQTENLKQIDSLKQQLLHAESKEQQSQTENLQKIDSLKQRLEQIESKAQKSQTDNLNEVESLKHQLTQVKSKAKITQTEHHKEIESLRCQLVQAESNAKKTQTETLKNQLAQIKSNPQQNPLKSKDLLKELQKLTSELELKEFHINALTKDRNILHLEYDKKGYKHNMLKAKFKKYDGVIKGCLAAMKNDEYIKKGIFSFEFLFLFF